jgi:hypothetical protein
VRCTAAGSRPLCGGESCRPAVLACRRRQTTAGRRAECSARKLRRPAPDPASACEREMANTPRWPRGTAIGAAGARGVCTGDRRLLARSWRRLSPVEHRKTEVRHDSVSHDNASTLLGQSADVCFAVNGGSPRCSETRIAGAVLMEQKCMNSGKIETGGQRVGACGRITY